MAIQMRRGNEADFDVSKMLPGEWAVSLDTKYVRMCFSPGLVLRMATYESFEADMTQIQAILAECKTIQSAMQRIQAEVNSKASLVVEYSDSAKKSADRAYSEAERAKTYANNAEAVTGVNIATQDRAGLVKGGDNYIAEDGTLVLIKETTSTTMPNSYSGRLKVEEIGGVCEQETTTGAQLFDKDACSLETGLGTSTGDTYVNTGQFTTDFIDVSNIEQLAFNGKSVSSGTFCVFYDSNKAFISSLSSSSGTITVPSGAYYVRMPIANEFLDTLMINIGTTALPYEPYTGGIPSPNPSYTQEIKKTVVSEIRTHGKNFLNARLNVEIGNNDFYTINNVKAGDSLTVYIKQQVTDLDTSYTTAQHYYWFYDKDGNILRNGRLCTLTFTEVNEIKEGTQSLVAPDNTNYFKLTLGTYFSNSKTKVKTIEAQVEIGTEFTGYEPYTESVITLSQPIELYGIGDVKDVIEGGKVKRKLIHVVYDGDENWKTSSSLVGRYYLDNIGCKNYGFVLCSHANGIRGSSVEVNVCYVNTVSNPNGRFNINTPFDTVDEWKAHLASNPMTLVFELATETTEELPIADQIALNSLSTFDGITYLEFDTEIEPTFKGEYGTSKVGGYTLEGMLASRNGGLLAQSNANRITALEATVVNNI